MNRPSEVLNSIEIDALIALFFYRATAEDRARVMGNLPLAYAKLFGGGHEMSDRIVDSVRRAIAGEVK